MTDEAPKYSASDFNEMPRKTEFSAHREAPSKESRINRFLNKINHFLNGSTPVLASESRLGGRIHQLDKDVDRMVTRLHSLRSELMEDKQLQLPALITSVIDPLIKEINRMEKARNSHLTAAQQVRESKDYTHWLEKSKKWIDLCEKRHTHKKLIYAAVIEHTILEFHTRIDRDLQVIQDYINHSLEMIEVNDLVKIECRDQLEQELSQHIFELCLLKDHPHHLTLEGLNSWRAEADIARESYFSAALHIIDIGVGELGQPRPLENSGDRHAMEIHAKLAELEEKVAKIEIDIKNCEPESRDKKKVCLANLAKLEDDAHILNSNLSLTHEQAERVQQVLEALSAYREQLQEF